MTDEDKKKIVSEPPPPTDEIDGEWGDDDETLVRDAPSLSDPPKVSVRPSAPASSGPVAAASAKPMASVQAAEPAETAAAPISDPPVAGAAAALDEDEDEDEDEQDDEDEDEQDDEDDEDDEDEDEDEQDDEDEASAQEAAVPAARAAQDWIPEWGPFAVLGLLVCVSIVFGLGLLGGSAPSSEEGADKVEPAKPAPSALKPATRPGAHP
jgi:hypothetical protein